MILKKNLFYTIILVIFFTILEILSANLIDIIKGHPLIIKSKNFYKSKKLTSEFKEYLNLIPYIDDSINFRKYIDEKSSQELFFTTFNKFKGENSENILIQGDSWAAAANDNLTKEDLTNIVLKKKMGLVNAGKISYSISPMNVQLDILLKKFNLKPSIIIAITDQTDIGDELHRYQSLSITNLELTDTRISFEFKNKITVDNLDFSYKKKKILEEINLVIQKGETIGIVGESGSGKSTLVDLLNGLLKPRKEQLRLMIEILKSLSHLGSYL